MVKNKNKTAFISTFFCLHIYFLFRCWNILWNPNEKLLYVPSDYLFGLVPFRVFYTLCTTHTFIIRQRNPFISPNCTSVYTEQFGQKRTNMFREYRCLMFLRLMLHPPPKCIVSASRFNSNKCLAFCNFKKQTIKQHKLLISLNIRSGHG